ncbi:MAG: 3-isopropylmalate dehydratase large subunit [Oscillospiraceae bacterium]|jgi:3-isopropylmalate/(R)-2-methylmalate dehydratase large subunit|nr:3-isopropylmalate dehydratase large subunit [Oscillospiraceae bacterium]
MAMTMSQKILARRAGLEEVTAGQLVRAKVDLVLGNDITSPVAVNEFEKAGFDRVFDAEKIVMVMDHFTPNKDIKAAAQCKQCREFAAKHGIGRFYDSGRAGVEHALLPEEGLAAPGELIIGADSHTCTYGALGAFSTGVGSTDMAAGMATGETWFKVPEALRFNLRGRCGGYVSGKDVILHIIGITGADGALYKSMEFGGEGMGSLSIDDRLCMANMVVEAGAKNGVFEVDGITRDYISDKVTRGYEAFAPDANARYAGVFDIDLSAVRPMAAFPHSPDNVKAVGDAGGVGIDQVVIGSCTNGRLSDMRTAAEILKGGKVARGVRCIVIPATQRVFLECIRLGYAEIFVRAGCVFNTPTCGPCLGGHTGILAEGERCVATTNRNFVGRMGHTGSEVYLASPATAAHSALTGKLSCP